ncbi:MAG: hypothetical protein ABI665_21500 [Vicinamibacterales bacterium]
MSNVSVVLSAYESGGSRLERLARTLLYVLARAENWGADVTPLHGLHDHKGTLQVSYSSAPNEHLQKLIEHAWAEEYEYSVEHNVEVAR